MKKLITRGLLGFPLGITIGYCITIIISIALGEGYYSPSPPSLVESMGGELRAVIFQTILCGILGAIFAASSVIWEIETWSIFKQTAIYFSITAATMLPIAYLANWMDHSLMGILAYLGIYILLFIVIWSLQYLIWKNKIKKMNAKLK